MDYSSENEQVEVLQRWWRKHGWSTVILLAAVLASVFGWKVWQQQRVATAAAAGAEYQALLGAAKSGSKDVTQDGRAIVAQYPNTPYAALTNLLLASQAVKNGKPDEAEAFLRWVTENAKLPQLRNLATIRLARLQLSSGKAEAALKLVEGMKTSGMDGYLMETKGDIYVAMGKEDAAREAYQKALDEYSKAVPSKQPLVSMKLDDLAKAEASAQ